MNFSSSLDHIARMYAAQQRIMLHWLGLFPDRIFEVSYPKLVCDLEGEVRSIAAFLDIGFDPAMLEPHRNIRPVRTASAQQVRQAVHRSSLNVWKHYREELGPVINTLQAEGVLSS